MFRFVLACSLLMVVGSVIYYVIERDMRTREWMRPVSERLVRMPEPSTQSLADALPAVKEVHEEPVVPTPTRARDESLQEWITALIDGNAIDMGVTPERLEQYVKEQEGDQDALLGAYLVGQDEHYLAKALEKDPENPLLHQLMLTQNEISPEAKRKHLDALLEQDPENTFTHVVAARWHLQAGEMEDAMNYLEEASYYGEYNGYEQERLLAAEETLLGLGNEPAKSLVAASMGLLVPELAELSGFSEDLQKARESALEAGNQELADQYAIFGAAIGMKLATRTRGSVVMRELVGLQMEKTFLEQIPAGSYDDWFSYPVEDMLAQNQSQQEELAKLSGTFENFEGMSDEEIVRFYRRLTVLGEKAALDWKQRQLKPPSEKSPGS